MKKSQFIYLLLSSLLTLLIVFRPSKTVRAAESVILNYGPFQEEVSIAELSVFVRSGKLSRSLKAYLRRVKREPKDLQSLLIREVPVDPVATYKFLNQIQGEALLDRISQVIHTPSQRASIQSLRAALVGSALRDGKIQLIEVLENYPTQDVYINGDRLAFAYNQINQFLSQLSR